MLRLICPFITGAFEWRMCAERGIGRSYDEYKKSNAYDAGVNLGQNVAEVAKIVRRPLTQHVPD